MCRIHVGVAAFWQYRHQLVVFAFLTLTTAMANTERSIAIINNSGSRVELYWIHVSAQG